MKKLIFTFCAIFICATSFAQSNPVDTLEEQTPWWIEGSANLSVNYDFKLNPDKLENSTNVAFNTDLTLHHIHENWRWDTQLIAQLKFKYDEDVKYFPWRKKNDHLELTTSLAYHLSDRIFIKGDLRFASIVAPKWFYYGSGENTTRKEVSSFLSPASLDLRPGLQWRPTATKKSYLELGATPIGGRLLICTLQDSLSRAACLGDYFAAKGNNINMMFGGYIDCKYTWEIKNFSGRAQTSMFFPYKKYGPQWDMDLNLDIRLSYKFAKVFSINFMIQSRYVNSAYRSCVITNKIIKENAEFRDRIDLVEQLTLGVGWTF
ncbi:MAG: DUF3078 domain-containing protein [Bacteroidales bacterium]|nr:DUF3078 domain-containing protein [Bacteroidales bacterium]